MPANFSDTEQRAHDPTAHEQRMDSEKTVGRNPHPDFGKVQAARENWREERSWNITKTRNPEWQLGDGANDGGASLKKEHVEIDPYGEGRPAIFNYKLLISGMVPRPIGFISTRSKDGQCRYKLSLCPAVRKRQEGKKKLMVLRVVDEPRSVFVHQRGKSRSPSLYGRLCRRLL